MSLLIPELTNQKDHKILNQLHEGIILLDKETRIQYCNKAAEMLLEIKNDDIQGKRWNEIFINHKGLDLYLNINMRGRIIVNDVCLPSGINKGIRLSISPLVEDGRMTEYLIIAGDASDIINKLTGAETANLVKTEFLAHLSHEIRTVLTAILGYCDLLSDEGNIEIENESVRVIKNCTHQLLGLASNIIDLSRIETGQIELAEKPFDLHKMLEQEILSRTPQARLKGLEIFTDFAADLPRWVIGDEVRIRQIVSNLLTNAIKYTVNGHIQMNACQHKYALRSQSSMISVQIEVSDTGMGIDDDLKDIIFEPYTRAENESHGETGIGLGLAISKQLVDVMNGLIWFEPNKQGGTRFSIVIPLEMVSGKERGDEVQSVDTIHTTNKSIHRQVLLVEDRSVNRKLVKLMLEDIGCSVVTAANGKECLEILNDIFPDIIFMDMQMPIMDGYSATRFIRESQIWEDVPVIALTANALKSDIDKCMEAGCDYYLSKPFNREDLIKIIRGIKT